MTTTAERTVPRQEHDRVLLPGIRVLERIGEGGDAVVHRAVTPTGRAVAVKLWRTPMTSRRRGRFHAECRMHDALSGAPGIPRLFRWGHHAELGPYLALELFERSLAEPAPDRTGDSPIPVLRLARGLATGLAVVHAHGLVHRDVKPANVLLRGDDVALGDLGAATGAWPAPRGESVGSQAWLAPEVLDGAPHSPRSDVYAAGLTLRALNGAGGDARVERAIGRAVDPDPGRRPGDGSALLRLLAAPV